MSAADTQTEPHSLEAPPLPSVATTFTRNPSFRKIDSLNPLPVLLSRMNSIDQMEPLPPASGTGTPEGQTDSCTRHDDAMSSHRDAAHPEHIRQAAVSAVHACDEPAGCHENVLRDRLHHHQNRKTANKWPDPRRYNAKSLHLFTLDHPLRKLAISGLISKTAPVWLE